MSYIKFIGTNQVELVNSLNGNKISPVSSGENFIEFGFKPLSKNDQDYYHFIITGENVQVSGWIGEVTRKQEFINLFKDCTQITDASGLTIGQTIYDDLKEACCANMFLNCTNLTTPPRITSINLAPWCYSGMFAGCTSLTSAPALPASTLAPYCYYAMFYNCKSLSTAPVLSASTLVDWCYNSMFYNCTSLTSISANFTEWKGNATSSWVTNVSPTGVFTNENTDFEEIVGNSNIPIGWIKDSDYLTFSAIYPYTFKLNDLTSAKTKQFKRRWASNGKWGSWDDYNYIIGGGSGTQQISGDASHLSGNFRFVLSASSPGFYTVKIAGKVNSMINFNDSIEDKQYYRLFRNCSAVVDASGLSLPHTELAPSCYAYMFEGCRTLSTAPSLPATTLAPYCYEGMFYNCKSLSTAPVLPATTLANWCYYQMFEGCTNLSSIEVAFTDWKSDIYATYLWVNGVAPTGIFYKPSALSTEYGVSRIPTNWTINNIDA